jgi:integrase
MARVQLSDRFCAHAKADASGRTDFFDAKTKGLALRCSEGGHRAWTFHFTNAADGKRARVTLGTYPATSLSAARAKALEARVHVEAGQDPRRVFAAQAEGGMTVAALIETYLTMRVRPDLRSAAAIERRFAKNVTPVLGAVRLADLHRRDVNRAIDVVLERGSAIEAARVFEDTRAMIRWAVRRGDLDRNPLEGMRKPDAGRPRERVLSGEEIRTLWHSLPKALARSKECQRIIKLCLVTAQRVGEVAGMERSELDLERGTWTLPSLRTKNKHTHVVPLSPLALDLIRESLADGARYAFPNPEGDGSLPPHAVARTIGRALESGDERPLGRFGLAHFTAHDLRRTAVTGMARLGIAPIVLGHVINHRSVTKADVTKLHYDQHDYAAEKRAALETWAQYLETIITGEKSK